MITKLFITLATLLVALTCRAQTLHLEVQDIQLGSSVFDVMQSLRSSRTVIDTADTIASAPNDIVIRMAPVKLCGVDGYLAMHTNRDGIVTNFYWTRQPKEGYYQGGVWASFRLWDDWKSATLNDLESMKEKLEKEMGPGDSFMMIPSGPHKKVEVKERAIVEITPVKSSSQKMLCWFWNGARYHLRLSGDMLEFGTDASPSR